MGIVFKHTLKNIFRKPFRTILVIFCVLVCAFTALLSFDLTGSIKYMLTQLYSAQLGTMDIIVSGNIPEELKADDKFSDCVLFEDYATSEPFFKDIDNQYAYVHRDDLMVCGVDLEAAKAMKTIPYTGDLNNNEIILSSEFVEDYPYEEGDIIVLHDIYDMPHEFVVKEIIDYQNKGLFQGESGVITIEAFKELDPLAKCNEIAIDIPDNGKAKEYIDYIEESYPQVNVMSIYDNEEMDEQIGSISKLFFILFAICMLMVIFVTISVSERIVVERMATVGTLRSLGLSVKLTTGILLLENAFYGLIGSILGSLLYNTVRGTFLGSLIVLSDDSMEITFGALNPIKVILVVIGAILIECLCPIKEIIRAVKTPIRDIIFANKDTAYKSNMKVTIVGLVSLVIGLILFAIRNNFWCAIIQFVLLTVALACLFPYAITFVGKQIEKVGIKLNKPSLQLAATQLYTKKSTVGSATLISTAVALAIVVVTFANSLMQNYKYEQFNSEIYFVCKGEESYKYSFVEHLDGVNDIEKLYSTYDILSINGERYDKQITIATEDDDGFTYFKALEGVPVINENEVVVALEMADNLGLSEGDVIEIEFLTDSYYPLRKTLTISKIVKTNHFDPTGQCIVINEQSFIDIYGDVPTNYFVSCEPDKVEEIDALIEKYGVDSVDTCYTRDEYDAEASQTHAMVLGVLYLAIGIGVGLTFIGAVTNLLVGFEGRKRECAVLLSTAMSKRKLKSIFRLESFLSSGIALITAFPFGILMTTPVFTALKTISLSIDKAMNIGSLIGFVLIMWVAFTLTSIFPNKALKKMKIAEQLKYE